MATNEMDTVLNEQTDTDKVRAAIEASLEVIPDYFESTLEQRLEGGAGSIYENIADTDSLREALLNASWEQREHPDVIPGCQAYVTTDIPGGHFGLVELRDLPDDTLFTAIDPKNTGNVSLSVEGVIGEPVQETWLIVGDEQGKDVVFTFHPGEPVRPSVVAVDQIADGTKLTKEEAMALGFEKAKIVAEPEEKVDTGTESQSVQVKDDKAPHIYTDFRGLDHIDNVIYKGVFLDSDASEKLRTAIEGIREEFGTEGLSKPILDLHVTTGFGKDAQDVEKGLIGEPVLLEVKGYANDGKNEGVEVKALFGHRNIMGEMEKVEETRPLHITISIAEDAKAVDTGKLSFEEISSDDRITVQGTYGVYATAKDRDQIDSGTEQTGMDTGIDTRSDTVQVNTDNGTTDMESGEELSCTYKGISTDEVEEIDMQEMEAIVGDVKRMDHELEPSQIDMEQDTDDKMDTGMDADPQDIEPDLDNNDVDSDPVE